MSARSEVLDGIRRSLHRGELTGEARAMVDQRLATPPRGPSVTSKVLAGSAYLSLITASWPPMTLALPCRSRAVVTPPASAR